MHLLSLMPGCVYVWLLRKESLKKKRKSTKALLTSQSSPLSLECYCWLGGNMRDLELAQQLQTEEDKQQRSEEEKQEREEFKKLQVQSCF